MKNLFKSNDYKSTDGMLTAIWGPSLWHSLHTISFNYPNKPTQKDKKNYKDWVKNLKYILPCKYCRTNLIKNFKELPLRHSDMKNRETFSKYIYNLHELINKMLGKKSGLSYCDVKERYEHFRARCGKRITVKTIQKKENGCTDPLNGIKSKCIIKIVPQNERTKTFQMNKKCKTIRTKKKNNVKKTLRRRERTKII
jgi:hypothetical protein|tara:strand:+ start:2247 stop:2837 length:591 start_codon:yes stop_codon:yes gene_type:complete